MNTKFLALVFLISCLQLKAQKFFDPYIFPDLSDPFLFLSDDVRGLKIDTLTFTYRFKPDNNPISTVHYKRIVLFNNVGKVEKILSITPRGAWNDTLESFFKYNKDGDLASQRSHDAFGYYRLEFVYDGNGRLKSEKFLREGPGGRLYLVGEESFLYQDYGTQLKRISMNAEGLPYKESITYFTEGKKTGETEKFQIGGGGHEIIWKFSGDQLDSVFISDYSENIENTQSYQYDDWQRLIGWNRSGKDGIIETGSVGWTGKLPLNIVIRREEKKEIEIIEISPGFRN